MNRGPEPAAGDPDLSATIRLWLDRPIREALRADPSSIAVVNDTVHDLSSWPNVVRPERPVAALLRKILVRAGATRDWAAIDHAETVEWRRGIVRSACDVLDVGADAPPAGFLLRVDDFPASSAGLDAFRDFHAIAREHSVPYLLAVTPFAAPEPGLSARAAETLRACVVDGVDLALHGFTHESRSPIYANELLGMSPAELSGALDRALAHFDSRDLPRPLGFVAPFNGFDRSTFGLLARRFPLVCGGPESVATLGYRIGPSFFESTLYVPSYRGAYDVADDRHRGLAALDRLAARSGDLPVPVTVHWANGVADRFAGLRRLCEHISGRVARWNDFVIRAHGIRSSASRP